jgi:hypothetical protein
LLQLLYLTMLLLNAALSFPPHEVLDALAVVVFASTVISGLNYMTVFTRRAWAAPMNQS